MINTRTDTLDQAVAQLRQVAATRMENDNLIEAHEVSGLLTELFASAERVLEQARGHIASMPVIAALDVDGPDESVESAVLAMSAGREYGTAAEQAAQTGAVIREAHNLIGRLCVDPNGGL